MTERFDHDVTTTCGYCGVGCRLEAHRSEGRIAINRILDRMANIRISAEKHGPEDDRKYEYEPTFIMRGLTALHVEYDPIPDA